MIVADSSFLVQGLLRDTDLLVADSIITLDLALHEVSNAIWKHEFILNDINHGIDFINVMHDLIDSGAVTLVTSNRKMTRRAYDIAAKYRVSFYDCIFIILSIETGLPLRTMDDQQMKILKAEKL